VYVILKVGLFKFSGLIDNLVMFWSRDYTFFKSKEDLDKIKIDMVKLLKIKDRSTEDINKYKIAFEYFRSHPHEFDGATVVKDLSDLKGLDLDALVHDYDYIKGANRNFIKKWKADLKYIKNMELQGKGIRVFRLFMLTIPIGIVFVAISYFKNLINK
jgi:hypothetical protein